MDQRIIIAGLFFLFGCQEQNSSSAELHVEKSPEEKNIIIQDSLPERPLHNWQLLDTANRQNIFEDTVPVFLKEFARKNEFPCPDTVTGCAACGHCAYIQLSDDWSYFAYERQETKHYCTIKIYGKTNSGIVPIDTLYGTVINALPVNGNRIYQLTLLEAYWEDERPMNVEFYQLEKGKFILKDSISSRW